MRERKLQRGGDFPPINLKFFLKFLYTVLNHFFIFFQQMGFE